MGKPRGSDAVLAHMRETGAQVDSSGWYCTWVYPDERAGESEWVGADGRGRMHGHHTMQTMEALERRGKVVRSLPNGPRGRIVFTLATEQVDA